MYFSTISKGQIKDLAKIIRRVIRRIKLHLGDVNYNMVLHTAPVNTSNRIDDIFHWHLELMPKLTKIAGFEWGTGYYINPVFPEDAAKMLREIELDDEELHSLNLKFQFLVEHLEDEPEVAVTYFKADERKAASLRVRPAKMGEGAFGYLIPIRVLLNNTDIVEATMMVGAITAEMIAAA